jgi:hypothetical protein
VRQLLASSLGVFMPSNPKEENLIYNEYGFVTAAVQK